MTFIIFIVILGILVLVHELGHFLVAKKAGVKVEEFGFGYPPRALLLGKRWDTVFSLNWIPFGGFVKILGENYEEEDDRQKNVSSEKSSGSLAIARPDFSSESFSGGKRFTEISKKWQAMILVAGVAFNFIFAWFLFSLGFMIGLPSSVENDFSGEVKNPRLTIVSVLSKSPAEEVGLRVGDRIESIGLKGGEPLYNLLPDKVSDFINNSSDQIYLGIDRGGQKLNFDIMPKEGILENKKIIGINMDMVGTVTLPPHSAILEGAKTTYNFSFLTVSGIFNLIKNAFVGKADISEISGPVGIIGLVGDASRLGFVYIVTFTALISVNLAVINLVPFPALDGGRLLFVLIESLTKKPINRRFAQVANVVGFFLLISLMIFVTYRDVLKLL